MYQEEQLKEIVRTRILDLSEFEKEKVNYLILKFSKIKFNFYMFIKGFIKLKSFILRKINGRAV